MNWPIVARMLGLLAMLVGGSMIFSLPWAFPLLGETSEIEYAGIRGILGAIVCSVVLGGALFAMGRGTTQSILRKEALAIVGLGWILAGVLGALPFILSGTHRTTTELMTPIDAIFESISGFTTTGASVLTELEDTKLVPRCVLFWRSFTHWLGGMGIIVLFVAILGQLGAGGKAMLKREVPGPITESVRPRVRDTAMLMWAIYVALTFIETALLCLEGVPLYHALCHAFGTLATGGFSTYNRSAGHFNGGAVEATVVVFMILAGTNFSLYYLIFRRHGTPGWRNRVLVLFRDTEYVSYLSIIAVATLLLTISLYTHHVYDRVSVAASHALFNVVSIMTTTGFGTEDFTKWSEFSKGLLLLLMFIGGSAGSTGGGIKVIRWVIVVKALQFEVERAFRPNVIRPVKIRGTLVDEAVCREVLVYFCMVGMVFIIGWLALISMEPDTQWSSQDHPSEEKLLDCFSAVAATLNNIGPGLGVVGPASNYSQFSQQGKFVLTLLMLLGRLELFAILVLFSPRFWRTQ